MHLTPHFLSSNQDIVVCSQEQKFRVCNIHSVEKLNEVVLPVPLYIAFFRFWLATELLVSIP